MIFWHLFKSDLLVVKKTIKDRLINQTIWIITLMFVGSYLYQALGMNVGFGKFQVAGVLVGGMLWFQALADSISFIFDIDSDFHFGYKFTLPIPNWLIFTEMACLHFLVASVITALNLVICKVVLWDKWTMESMHIGCFALSLFMVILFVSVFTFFIISFIKNTRSIANAIGRMLFPLWFFGGFQYSFKTIYSISKPMAYMCWLNPITHATELLRGSMLGFEEFLPYWQSMLFLCVSVIVCGYVGIYRIKRKLDLV